MSMFFPLESAMNVIVVVLIRIPSWQFSSSELPTKFALRLMWGGGLILQFIKGNLIVTITIITVNKDQM